MVYSKPNLNEATIFQVLQMHCHQNNLQIKFVIFPISINLIIEIRCYPSQQRKISSFFFSIGKVLQLDHQDWSDLIPSNIDIFKMYLINFQIFAQSIWNIHSVKISKNLSSNAIANKIKVRQRNIRKKLIILIKNLNIYLQ